MTASVPLVLLTSVASGLLLTACMTETPTSQEESPRFVLRSLDLNQRRDDGQRHWDLTSPVASYDLQTRTVQARQTVGILYRDDRPSFRISANQAEVINDGERIVLEGQVRLQQLDSLEVLIRGDRLVWTPKLSRMVIDRSPEAMDATSHLRAQSLVLIQDQDLLQLKGATQLRHWPGQRRDDQPPETIIRGGPGRWNLLSGQLRVGGPVVATRQDNRRLTASALKGNTAQQQVDLVTPVDLELGRDRGTLQAGTTRWLYGLGQFRSTQPFQGQRGKATLTGNGFVIHEPTSSVLVTSDCRLNQPNESLRADRCSWNWQNQRIVASGQVLLRRNDLNQETRAERMQGILGDQQGLQFDGDKQRVRSSIRLKPPSLKQSSTAPVLF